VDEDLLGGFRMAVVVGSFDELAARQPRTAHERLAVGVLQPHAERLADVSDDTVARRRLVELARTDSNRRGGRRASGLAA
jgi:hypothetical protein